MITTQDIALQYGGERFKDVNLNLSRAIAMASLVPMALATFSRFEWADPRHRGLIWPESAWRRNQNHFAFEEEGFKHRDLGTSELSPSCKKKMLLCQGRFFREGWERTAELESRFAELNGWEAEPAPASRPGSRHFHSKKWKNYRDKVKVLLARALLETRHSLLDEPTNDLDLKRHQLAGKFIMSQEESTSWSPMIDTS